MTIKATSALSILAIWATMIPAIIAEPDAWWSLIFAVLATGAIGALAWRRLGLSRLIAISGTWLGTAIAISDDADNAWIAVFAFLTTVAVVYSIMRRDAYLAGLAIGVAWLMTAAVAVASDGDGAWISIFAFLTGGAISNTGGSGARGLSATLWWGAAGIVMLAADGWHWLAVIAFVLSTTSVGFSDFKRPRGLEWDLFDRDQEPAPADEIKVVN